MISSHGVFTSYQVNVDAAGDNIVGDAVNEPCITMDPNNPIRIAIGWRQFNNWQSNFRQGGFGYTTDGGLVGMTLCRSVACGRASTGEMTTTEISRRVRCANFQVTISSPIKRT